MLNESISAAILRCIRFGGAVTPTGGTATNIKAITSIRFYPSNPLVDNSNSSPSASFNASITTDNLYITNNNAIQIQPTTVTTYNYAGLLDTDGVVVVASKLPTPLRVNSSLDIKIGANEFTISFINL
jgi:hypothetical protein